ncbi:equilibrative nucleobase transporter 1-like isoform X2 [Boleophthalmus pectinirostris]|uniref:equilibrative nucleobase transporter 1-like isoform X2 n=1 Tax=Boleophthalmus pectinirostris TaxID=150288 RepID=UPI00242AFE2B|nr:equilibrative nucleobase transporter 1-like isoform X2 [Boleophthalmus pectinirostris]
MACERSSSGVRRWLTFTTGLLECLCFAGAVFGWASLVIVLRREGYFSSLCVNTTSVRATGLNRTEDSERLNFSSAGVNNTHPLECSEQDEHFSLVFTITSFASNFLSFPSGFLFDWVGTTVARLCAICIFTLGTLMVAFSAPALSVLLFPALSLMGVAGRMYLMTNMQVGNLFGARRSTVITVYTGAFGSSSLLFLVIKLLYEAGVPLYSSFLFLSACSAFLVFRTLFLLPLKRIPYPVPEHYTYGIICCNSNTVMLGQNEANNNSHMTLSETSADDNTCLNELSFCQCVRSSFFFWHLLWLSVIQLRHYLFIGTLNPMLQRLSEHDQSVVSQYSNAFAVTQLCGVLCAPWNGLIMDRYRAKLKSAGLGECEADLRAAMLSLTLTSLFCVLFSVCAMIPVLQLQYFTFFLQVLNRAFYTGSDAAFIHVIFPSCHFGKLYGLIKGLSALLSLLQYPCFILVEDILNGDPLYVNIGLTVLVLVIFIHPVSVYIYCQRIALKQTLRKVNIVSC